MVTFGREGLINRRYAWQNLEQFQSSFRGVVTIMALLTIGDQFPAYDLKAVVGGDLSKVDAKQPDDYFIQVTSSDNPGKWRVIFFWPKDFTFICPTEIATFGKLNDEFEDRDAQVLGVSVDNEFVHFQWRAQHEDLKKLPFPMVSDLNRRLCEAAGVLNADGVADRATFIVDPNNEIQFASVTAGSVGRNVEEVLRVLDALQSDELCACNWKKGDPTINVGELLAEAV
jgi:peroxiredoxin (alkyl hydroperoxide reductase subunit C)